jgi:hypothetical protein
MKHFIFFALMLISISVPTRAFNPGGNDTDSLSLIRLTGETYFERKGYKGEQFYNKNWMTGDILLSNAEMIYDEALKYNGLLDELIWHNKYVNQNFKLDKFLINEFWLRTGQNVAIHFKHITVNNLSSTNKQSDIFAEVGVEGRVSLYIQRKISIVNVDDVSIDGTLYKQETIRATPMYYLKLSSDSYVLLEKIKLKSLLQLFPTKKEQITKLVKNNKLKLKTEVDLFKLIVLLNNQSF